MGLLWLWVGSPHQTRVVPTDHSSCSLIQSVDWGQRPTGWTGRVSGISHVSKCSELSILLSSHPLLFLETHSNSVPLNLGIFATRRGWGFSGSSSPGCFVWQFCRYQYSSLLLCSTVSRNPAAPSTPHWKPLVWPCGWVSTYKSCFPCDDRRQLGAKPSAPTYRDALPLVHNNPLLTSIKPSTAGSSPCFWSEVKWSEVPQSCLTLCDPMEYSPWNSPGQNTGVGSLFLLQGIFPTQGLNPGLPYRRQFV